MLEANRRRRLRRNFDLTPDEYDAMLAAQGGRCAICRIARCASGRRLAVDHCHVDGHIRGLLCRRCNQVLGQLGDDPQMFLRAAAYLTAGDR